MDNTVLSDSVDESLTSRQIIGTGLDEREVDAQEDFLEGERGGRGSSGNNDNINSFPQC